MRRYRVSSQPLLPRPDSSLPSPGGRVAGYRPRRARRLGRVDSLRGGAQAPSVISLAQASMFLLGLVVGYLASGMIVGPSVLAVIAGVVLGVALAVAVGRYYRRRGVSELG